MLILLLHVTEAIKDAVHVISLVGVGHFPLQGFELVVKIADASAACDRFIQDRTALHFLDVLAKVADRQLLRDRDRAIVRTFLADHHPEERCLPCPVRTDQPDFFARIQLKRSIHKEHLLAILLIDVRERDHFEEQLAAPCLFQCSEARSRGEATHCPTIRRTGYSHPDGYGLTTTRFSEART